MDWMKMSDDELLDAWHNAQVAHRTAATDDLDKYFILTTQGEAAAVVRFGLGKHMDAYRARFPNEK